MEQLQRSENMCSADASRSLIRCSSFTLDTVSGEGRLSTDDRTAVSMETPACPEFSTRTTSRAHPAKTFATLNGAGFAIHDFVDLERLPDSAEVALGAWVERAGKQLSETVRVATAMFDPALIILGGRLPELVTDKLVGAISSQPILGPSRGLEVAAVEASRLGPRAGAIGAACIPFFASLFSAAVADDGSPYLNGRKPKSRP